MADSSEEPPAEVPSPQHPSPSPAVAAASSEGLTTRLAKLWLVAIPGRLARAAPTLADSFRDGAWTAAWPPVAAFAPVVAVVIGLVAPFLLDVSYTESLALMMLVVVAAILSGPVGVMLLAGYAVGNFLFGGVYFGRLSYANPLLKFVTSFAGKLIVLGLLAFPAVLLPVLARRLVWPLAGRAPFTKRLWVTAALYATVCGALAFLWSQAMPVLVRPVFVLPSGGLQATTEAIASLQSLWPWLVAVGFAAGATRVIAENRILRRFPGAAEVTGAYRTWWMRAGHHPSPWQRAPLVLRVAVVSVAGAALLAGTYEQWFDPLIAFVAIGLLEVWRQGVRGGWVNRFRVSIRRIPIIVRFALGVALGYWIAYLVVEDSFLAGSFRPVLVGALASMAVLYLLLPTLERGSTT